MFVGKFEGTTDGVLAIIVVVTMAGGDDRVVKMVDVMYVKAPFSLLFLVLS